MVFPTRTALEHLDRSPHAPMAGMLIRLDCWSGVGGVGVVGVVGVLAVVVVAELVEVDRVGLS